MKSSGILSEKEKRQLKKRTSTILIILTITLIVSCSSVPESKDLKPPEEFADAESKFIKADGVKIHYKEIGYGNSSLVMLHGMLGNLESWHQIAPLLSSSGYRVTAYDRPAFGLTNRPAARKRNNPYTPEAQTAQAMQLMKKLGIEKPVLIGHSAGGNLAMRLAIENPASFKALILISPGIFTEIPPKLIRELFNLDLLEPIGLNIVRGIPQQIDNLIERTYYNPESVSEYMFNAYTQPLKIKNWDRAIWEYIKAQDDTMLKYNLEKITIPVLIIQGREDRIIPVFNNRILADALPDAELQIIEKCGHVAHEEATEATAAIILDFLSRL